MTLLFADAWYFIALLNRRDAGHRGALRLRGAYPRAHVVTHDAVLTEVLTFFAEAGPTLRHAAAAYVRAQLADPSVTVFPADRAIFLAALSLYERRQDKGYSLVDCISMTIAQTHGITHVLTNDHHFRQEGFQVVSDAP
ncbi:MAG: uncharacterized protein QOH21_1768 [Acidobacteriota bacterium]|jgi:predicted nucleic acid-binding protein|nr:uncharacterized protein [Acidobacteriota bacterium]